MAVYVSVQNIGGELFFSRTTRRRTCMLRIISNVSGRVTPYGDVKYAALARGRGAFATCNDLVLFDTVLQ